MKAIDINSRLVDTYLELLKNLDPKVKLDLINKLSLSVKTDLSMKKSSFNKAFGAWDKEDDAELIITEIRESRNFNRIIESLWWNIFLIQIFVFTTWKCMYNLDKKIKSVKVENCYISEITLAELKFGVENSKKS